MEVFYFAGIALVIAALVIAYVGISGAATFPPSRPLLAAGIAVFAHVHHARKLHALPLAWWEYSPPDGSEDPPLSSPMA